MLKNIVFYATRAKIKAGGIKYRQLLKEVITADTLEGDTCNVTCNGPTRYKMILILFVFYLIKYCFYFVVAFSFDVAN